MFLNFLFGDQGGHLIKVDKKYKSLSVSLVCSLKAHENSLL